MFVLALRDYFSEGIVIFDNGLPSFISWMTFFLSFKFPFLLK